MPEFHLACLVEGEGDVRALPALLRKLRPGWSIGRPARTGRGGITSGGEKLLRHLAASQVAIDLGAGRGAVLALIDADKDCPAVLQAAWRERIGPQKHPVVFVAAKRGFETWILAGHAGLAVDDAERRAPRRAELEALKPGYSKTLHQASLASQIDPKRAAARSASFTYLLRVLDELAIDG